MSLIAIAQDTPWWHYIVILEDRVWCPPTNHTQFAREYTALSHGVHALQNMMHMLTLQAVQSTKRTLLQVTFLYTLTDGACPKSYGINVARLAGLPVEVVKRASCFATQLEEQHQSRILSMPLQQSEMQRLQNIRQGMTKDCVSPNMHL